MSELIPKVFSRGQKSPLIGLIFKSTNGMVSSNTYDKQNDFKFEIVIFPFLDGDAPWSPSYSVYTLQLIRLARAWSYVTSD